MFFIASEADGQYPMFCKERCYGTQSGNVPMQTAASDEQTQIQTWRNEYRNKLIALP